MGKNQNTTNKELREEAKDLCCQFVANNWNTLKALVCSSEHKDMCAEHGVANTEYGVMSAELMDLEDILVETGMIW
jgi:hypothetical protein